MVVIQSIKNFIEKCPFLDEFNDGINVNYLDDETTSYSVETVPIEPIVKRYVDGSCIKQFVFIFCSKESYGQDVMNNIEKSGFYEKLSEWLEEQTLKKNFPDLGTGKQVTRIEATSTGYQFQTDIDKARYQIQCRILYFEEGKVI